jgi:hypothetical protein
LSAAMVVRTISAAADQTQPPSARSAASDGSGVMHPPGLSSQRRA